MSTNQLSPERVQRSRNMQSDILHAVAETKQVNVAKCLGVDSSTVGRWLDSKNEESQVVRFCDMLALCGLKIVPANAKHYDAEKIAILFRVAKYHFQNLEQVDDFFENDAGMTESHEVRYSRVGGLSCVNAGSNIVLAFIARYIKACKSLFIAPKVAHYDAVADRKTLLNATQVAQSVGLKSAQALNKRLSQVGVYNSNCKRGKAFQAWFIQRGLGEMKQGDTGHMQPLFTTKGQMWVYELLNKEVA